MTQETEKFNGLTIEDLLKLSDKEHCLCYKACGNYQAACKAGIRAVARAVEGETITCECGQVVPLTFAQCDSEGVDLCPACYIGLLSDLIQERDWIPVSEKPFPKTSHERRQTHTVNGVVTTIHLESHWRLLPAERRES